MEEKTKELIRNAVEENMEELCRIRTYLYENPEVGGEEEKAYTVLTDTLKNHGFDITYNFHNIPYCFRAVYDSGKSGPSIGMTMEFDALPGMGHGCGHNLIATAPMGAAFALRKVLGKTGGRVVLFGTPGEECVCSKVQLSEERAFDEADVLMTIHPNPVNLSSGSTTAIDSWQVDFHGKSSHAGSQPEDGINALDAAVHFYTLIGFEKQYLKNTNIYGVFADGGEKCSVIPDFAAVKYLVRGKDVKSIDRIRDMFERCAQAAAGAVGATYRIWRNEPANKNMITNRTMADVFDQYYEELGGGQMPHIDSTGSTDMGDASHTVPSIHPWLGLNCPECQLHSKEFADKTLGEEGDQVIRRGACALAMTATDILTSPELLSRIKEEFALAVK